MESLAVLNQRLQDFYGVETVTGRPIFRIVWANDQTEKRLMDTVDSGIHLLFPEVREVKKYSYLKDLFVLERLVIVPEENQKELPTDSMSYEPIWAYRDSFGSSVPVLWEPTKFIVDSLYAALGKKSLRKYVDSEENTTPEGREQRIDKIEAELFGDDTKTSDALAYDTGVVVPTNYGEKS